MSENGPVRDVQPPNATGTGFGSQPSGFWGLVWLGITHAGALYGLLLGLVFYASKGVGGSIFGAIFGSIVGLFYAGIAAAPIVFIIAAASRAVGRVRYRRWPAIIAGGWTGLLTSIPLAAAGADEELGFHAGPPGVATVAVAAILGRWERGSPLLHGRGGPGPMPLSTQGIDYRGGRVASRIVTAGITAAILAAVVASCIGMARMGGHGARACAYCANCRNNLKQLELCLANYVQANGSLPAAYTIDKAGKPLLSWRVAVAPYYFYNLRFSENVDAGQPWNSPKNAKFLDPLGSMFHCPSSGKKRDNALTDYVAVVGPDTLWPGRLPGDQRKHPKGILVVEWPKSDIHWAEPLGRSGWRNFSGLLSHRTVRTAASGIGSSARRTPTTAFIPAACSTWTLLKATSGNFRATPTPMSSANCCSGNSLCADGGDPSLGQEKLQSGQAVAAGAGLFPPKPVFYSMISYLSSP